MIFNSLTEFRPVILRPAGTDPEPAKPRLVVACLLVLLGLQLGLPLEPAEAKYESPRDCETAEGKTVRKILFWGVRHTKDKVITRELIHRPGQPFRCGSWETERLRLEGLDIFALVDLQVRPHGDSVDLAYQFRENPMFIPFIGAKKTDQDGLILGPFTAFLNLFGRDIRFETHLRTSVPDFGEANEVLTYITSPWLGDWPLEYFLLYNMVDSYNTFLNFRERSHRFWAGTYFPLVSWLEGAVSGEYFHITVREGDPQSILLSQQGSREAVPRLSAGLRWDNRDSKINPHSGLYGEAWVARNGEPLAGPVKYTEYTGDLRYFHTFAKKNIIHLSLLGQWRQGLPARYDYFFVGGANTLRGYTPGELTGRNEALATLEYRYEWVRNKYYTLFGQPSYFGWQWVLGLDAAYLWESGWSGDGFAGGYYGGFHFLLPGLDRLRVELGNGWSRVNLQFHAGLFEKSATQRWRIR